MIRKAIILVLTLSAVSCGTRRVCYTFESSFLIGGQLVDSDTGEPIEGVFVEITVIGEEGQLGDVATGMTDAKGAISVIPPYLHGPPPNRVVTDETETCTFHVDPWPFGLVEHERELDPLPDPTRIILTIDPDGAAIETTFDFSQDMLTRCREDRTFCVLDLGIITLTQP